MSAAKKLNDQMHLRQDIYFAMNIKQQRKINNGIGQLFIENIDMTEFKKITKSKKLHKMLVELKTSLIRSV